MSNTDNFVIVSKMFIYSHGKDEEKSRKLTESEKRSKREALIWEETCKREEKGLGKALPNTEKSAASPISLRPQRAIFLLVWISTKQEKGGPQYKMQGRKYHH